jgi:hypothetical protein
LCTYVLNVLHVDNTHKRVNCNILPNFFLLRDFQSQNQFLKNSSTVTTYVVPWIANKDSNCVHTFSVWRTFSVLFRMTYVFRTFSVWRTFSVLFPYDVRFPYVFRMTYVFRTFSVWRPNDRNCGKTKMSNNPRTKSYKRLLILQLQCHRCGRLVRFSK